MHPWKLPTTCPGSDQKSSFYSPPHRNHAEDILDTCCFCNFTYYYEFKVLKTMASDHFPVILAVNNIALDIPLSKGKQTGINFKKY